MHIHRIMAWFKKAIPEPTTKSVSTQLGVHFEEIKEMVEILADAAADRKSEARLSQLVYDLDKVQRTFKENPEDLNIDLNKLDRVGLLDAICDQIVTAAGVGYQYRLDVTGGLEEVCDSNASKFDKDGQAIFDENGKIMKGPNYFKPDLSKYI